MIRADMKHLVVIPAFNAAESLPRTIEDLQRLPEHYELLVVDDGSRDRTGAVAEGLARRSRLTLHVLHLPVNTGIGGAVQTGYLFAATRGVYQYVIQFDGDGQHPADDLVDGVALVVGRHHHREQRVLDGADTAFHDRYPWGCAWCQAQAVRTIDGNAGKRGVHPSSASAFRGDAYRTAGSPGRRGASAHGTFPPESSSTAPITSLTEWGRPVPRLYAADVPVRTIDSRAST